MVGTFCTRTHHQYEGLEIFEWSPCCTAENLSIVGPVYTIHEYIRFEFVGDFLKVSWCSRTSLIPSTQSMASSLLAMTSPKGHVQLSFTVCDGFVTSGIVTHYREPPCEGQNLEKTFCNSCYLGVVSAGSASGDGSAERRYLLKHVLKSEPFTKLQQREPQASSWSRRRRQVKSPLVLKWPDRLKQDAAWQAQ